MTAWRMAFRNGSRGKPLWDQCRKYGLAVIAYEGMEFDLLKNPPEVAPDLWAELAPAQKYSLYAFAYRVKTKHVIYAKEGTEIVGRGLVNGAYRYDSSSPVKDENGERWPHILDVSWQMDFPHTKVWVGDNQRYTVRPLSSVDLRKLRRATRAAKSRQASQEQREYAIEGGIEMRQRLFRRRNRAIILDKKERSDYRCEICGLKYEGMYGDIGTGYIIAHHRELLAGRKGASRTTLNDIVLLCANCHAMIHQGRRPFRPSELRNRLRWVWDSLRWRKRPGQART